MKIINLNKKSFAKQIEKEIRLKLFPHLNSNSDHGYPFRDHRGMHKARLEGENHLRSMLLALDQATRQMPEAEGQAFYYIAVRDLNECLAMYLQFAQKHKQ
jgi:hypothetical protein